ncbi:endoribonuclease LACTB2 isoform X2 [Belonocnema kinseyi]|uniref:endoribonuclease LACTB2 isoform X2 n=1 Tax=Belonocnema kinseyi TaxID=2817044 RepID=UPI00143DFDC7|nr:endoribonuclease LACTB2 isoform X2 [Belonocnema kinseyi]
MTSLTVIPLVSKLASNVIRILGCNPGPMTLQGTNTYLVGKGHRRVLIDSGEAGTAQVYTELLSEVLDSEGATIEHMLITHWHHDHIGGVSSIQKLLKSKNSKPATVWKLRRCPRDDQISEQEKSVKWQYLVHDQWIEVEGAKLQVKHSPGHTTDHYCLFMPKEDAIFSGDCILGEGTAVFEDLHDYIISLRNMLQMKPKLIYPGHGPIIENPLSRIQYYIEHRQKREEEILKTLQEKNEPMSEMEIVKNVYKVNNTRAFVARCSIKCRPPPQEITQRRQNKRSEW